MAKQILMPEVDGSMIIFAGSDNQIHVYSQAESVDDGLYTQWSVFHVVSTQNQPIAMDYNSNITGKNLYNSFLNDPYSIEENLVINESFPFLDVYGQIEKYFIGTIGAGVYVADESSLSKIGFTSSVYTDRPLVINNSQIVWIGQDDNLYIAEIDHEALKETGVQDVPKDGFPFRTISDSTVYVVKFYQRLNKFESAQDYYDYTSLTYAQTDNNFSQVVFIADNAFTAKYGDITKDSIESWKLGN